MFSHIDGNEAVKKYLTKTIEKDAIGNSLLFAGPKGAGKSLFAKAFAEAIICRGGNIELHKQKLVSGNHPDIHFYHPEGKIGMHSIQAMRELSEEVYLPPYEADRKVFIINDAERMLSYSSNALLKTFEEPSVDTVIILVSSAPELLLPTIISRCRTVHFQPNVQNENEGYSSKDPLIQMMLEILSKGKFESYTELVSKSKELAEKIESEAKGLEEGMRTQRVESHSEKLTALQRESLDKELDGVVAMHTTRAASKLFDCLLAWHRDILLLSVNGNSDLLFFKNSVASLKSAGVSRPKIPFERLFKDIEAAKMSLSRSTSLNLCLENLFLKLDFI